MSTPAHHLATSHADPVLGAITFMGSGRIGPTVTALIGLTAVVLGGRALLRARRRTDAPVPDPLRQLPVVFGLGLTAVLLGAVFLAAADSGPGTGDGVVGSAAAIALGVVALGLDRVAVTQFSH